MGLLDRFMPWKDDSDDSGGGLATKALNRHLDSSIDSYHKGGIVRKTGLAQLKKGERVLTKAQQRKRGGK